MGIVICTYYTNEDYCYICILCITLEILPGDLFDPCAVVGDPGAVDDNGDLGDVVRADLPQR